MFDFGFAIRFAAAIFETYFYHRVIWTGGCCYKCINFSSILEIVHLIDIHPNEIKIHFVSLKGKYILDVSFCHSSNWVLCD